MTNEEIYQQLISMPRRERAKEQRQPYLATIAGRAVVRLTRRYWQVDGAKVKLDRAIDLVAW